MSDAEKSDADPVLGSTVEDATEAVVEREPDADPESVRSVLKSVAADGTINQEGINSILGNTAQYVATPENRLELAHQSFESARSAAEPVADVPPVRSRLDALEARRRGVETEVDGLLDRLDAAVRRSDQPADVYEFARVLEDLRMDVQDAHGNIEELRSEVEAFENWVSDPETRYDELDDDVEYVAELVDGLGVAVDALESGSVEGEREPAVVWADASLRCRVNGLLIADLRAELSELRDWPEAGSEADGGVSRERWEGVGDRLDGLRQRESDLRERLEALARPEWRERFGDRIDAFEAEIATFEPPVRWERVQETLAEHQPEPAN
jgi:hypothetical protein